MVLGFNGCDDGSWDACDFAIDKMVGRHNLVTLLIRWSDTLLRSAASRPPTLFVSGGLAIWVKPVETRLAHVTGIFFLTK